MLPSDMGLKYDNSFATYAYLYATNETRWNLDFAAAFAKLIALGTDQNMGWIPRSPSLSHRFIESLNLI